MKRRNFLQAMASSTGIPALFSPVKLANTIQNYTTNIELSEAIYNLIESGEQWGWWAIADTRKVLKKSFEELDYDDIATLTYFHDRDKEELALFDAARLFISKLNPSKEKIEKVYRERFSSTLIPKSEIEWDLMQIQRFASKNYHDIKQLIKDEKKIYSVLEQQISSLLNGSGINFKKDSEADAYNKFKNYKRKTAGKYQMYEMHRYLKGPVPQNYKTFNYNRSSSNEFYRIT